MIKKIVIFFLSLSLVLSFFGARQAKAGEISLRATCESKDNLTICSLTIKNIGNESCYVNPHHFSLITQDGTSYPYALGTYTEYGYFLSKDLSPEEEMEGKLAFQVAGEPEYLVFDDGWGAKAKVSLKGEIPKEEGIEIIEQPKIEEREEPVVLAEIQPKSICQKEVEDLKNNLLEKDSQIAFLKESVKKLGDKITEVKKEEKEEIEGLRTEVEEQNLRLKEKEDLLSKRQEEKEKGPNNKSKLIPLIFLIGAGVLIAVAK